MAAWWVRASSVVSRQVKRPDFSRRKCLPRLHLENRLCVVCVGNDRLSWGRASWSVRHLAGGGRARWRAGGVVKKEPACLRGVADPGWLQSTQLAKVECGSLRCAWGQR